MKEKRIEITAIQFSSLPGSEGFTDLDLRITLGDHINIYTRDEVLDEAEFQAGSVRDVRSLQRIVGGVDNGNSEQEALVTLIEALSELPAHTYIAFGSTNEEEGFPIKDVIEPFGVDDWVSDSQGKLLARVLRFCYIDGVRCVDVEELYGPVITGLRVDRLRRSLGPDWGDELA